METIVEQYPNEEVALEEHWNGERRFSKIS
jgi:hypothetical protein